MITVCKKHGFNVCPHCIDEKEIDTRIQKEKIKEQVIIMFGVNRKYDLK
jgi:hypothetical protein